MTVAGGDVASIRQAGERLRRLIEEAPPGEPLPVEEWEAVLKPLLRSSFPGSYPREADLDACFRREAARRAALVPLARDPRTPPATLYRIVERLEAAFRYGATLLYPEPRLAAAIVGNPNATPDALTACATDFPKEFCRNPVVPLLALEDPAFIASLSAGAVGRVLRRDDAPGPLLAAFAAGHWGAGRSDSPDRREEARLHVGLAGEAGPDEWEPAARRFWLLHAARLREWTEWEALCDFAAAGLLPGELYRKVRQAGEWTRLCEEALDPETGRERLDALRGQALGRNRDTDRVALRAALALNPKTPRPAPEHDHLPRRFAGYPLRADATDESARDVLRMAVRRWWASRPSWGMPLLTLLLLLDAAPARPTMPPRPRHREAAVSLDWRMRLVAALTLPAASKAGRNLLGVLAGDGNRLVRAAAKARIEDPTRIFRFG